MNNCSNKNSDYSIILEKACISGNKEIIKCLINTKLFNINKRTGILKLTPLMIVICKEYYDCVKILIDNEANVNIKDIYGNTPLTYMLKYSKINENIYNLLIKKGAYIENTLFENKTFMKKIINNNIFIKLFINKKIYVKYESDKKASLIEEPFKFSLKLNNYEFIKVLLNNDIIIKKIYENKNEYLMIANKIGNQYVIKLLSNYIIISNDNNNKSKINSNKKFFKNGKTNQEIINQPIYKNEKYNITDIIDLEKNSYSELHLSCIKGNSEMIRLILNCNIFNINEKAGIYKLTPLMLLIIKEDYNNAIIYMKNKANVNEKDIYNNTPFMYMLKNLKYNEKIYKSLIKNDAYIDIELFYYDKNFIQLIIKNPLFIKYFMNKQIKVKNNHNNRIFLIKEPLIFSINTKSEDLVKVLLDNNIDIDEKDKNGNNPFIEMKKINNNKVTLLLENYKNKNNSNDNVHSIVDTNLVNYDRKNKKYLSFTTRRKRKFKRKCKSKKRKIIKKNRIENILNKNNVLNHNDTIFEDYMIEKWKKNENNKIKKRNKKVKKNKKKKNDNRKGMEINDISHKHCLEELNLSQLMNFIKYKKYKEAKQLLKTRPNVNIRDFDNNTPFMHMLTNFELNKKIYELLIKNDAFIDYKLFKNSETLKKIISNHLFIKFLIKKKIKINNNGHIILVTNPLIFSIKLNDIKFVKILLQNHINLYEQDENNNDPMTVALNIGNKKIIKLLKKKILSKKHFNTTSITIATTTTNNNNNYNNSNKE